MTKLPCLIRHTKSNLDKISQVKGNEEGYTFATKNSLMCCIRKPLWTLCFDSYCGILRSSFVIVPRFRGTPVLNFFYNRFLAQSHTVLVIDGTRALASGRGCGAHITYSTELHTSNLTDPDFVRIQGGQTCNKKLNAKIVSCCSMQ